MDRYSQSLFSQSQQPIVSTGSQCKQQHIDESDSQHHGVTQPFSTCQSVSSSFTGRLVAVDSNTKLTVLDPNGREVLLRSVTELPEHLQQIFPFTHFNIVQSKMYDAAIHSDESIVLCAPTGSGKTVLFELAIVKMLLAREQSNDSQHGIFIYMAPIKALCSERFDDWKKKFEPFGLTCKELTGDTEADDFYSLRDASLIFTTPEKWDSMTRRWKDNKSFIKQIKLFLIDEVHLLNDGTRGATVEAVVSRMKLVMTQLHLNDSFRIIAVSATMANINDIAEWLGSRNTPAISYKLGDEYRPVPLQRHVYGYNSNDKSDFKFDFSLNYKLPEIIAKHSNNRPTLIFVSTRKGTQQTADRISKSTPLYLSADARRHLEMATKNVKDAALRECIRKGVGFHNAGLDFTERKTVEELFAHGNLPILVSTSTLAMGVNLPAHLVIIKSTQHYTSNGFDEYSETEILQMIGRAGRPQFDKTATAVIMTKMHHQMKYEKLVGGRQIIESSLHRNLIEHLNAEIVLGTIPQISVALDWLKATFLYVRIMKNPTHYGLKGHQTRGSIEAYLQQLCVRQLDLLTDIRMISSVGEGDRRLLATESGKLMARYCISYGTMSKIDKLTGQETQEELITFVANCQEFNDMQLRTSEKKVLNDANKSKSGAQIRYPMKGKIKSSAMKVCCLIQLELGCLPISDFSLSQDTSKVFRTASRITKCLVELYMTSDRADCLYNAIMLNKCICSHLWENSAFITKQLPGIGIKNATCFANAGVHTFSKLLDLHPRDVELICSRHPPFGNGIVESITHLPKYEMAIDQKMDKTTIHHAVIEVALRLANKEEISAKVTARNHCVLLLIYDKDNKVVLVSKIFDTTLVKSSIWHRTVSVSRATRGDELHVCLLSLTWVGLDICSVFTPKYSGAAFIQFRQEVCMNEKRGEVASSSTVNHTQRATRVTPALSQQTESGCAHKCINKTTCKHLCCKPKTLQDYVSQSDSSTSTKGKSLSTLESQCKVQPDNEQVQSSRQNSISSKLSQFARTRPASYPGTSSSQKSLKEFGFSSTNAATDSVYGNFDILTDSIGTSDESTPSEHFSQVDQASRTDQRVPRLSQYQSSAMSTSSGSFQQREGRRNEVTSRNRFDVPVNDPPEGDLSPGVDENEYISYSPLLSPAEELEGSENGFQDYKPPEEPRQVQHLNPHKQSLPFMGKSGTFQPELNDEMRRKPDASKGFSDPPMPVKNSKSEISGFSYGSEGQQLPPQSMSHLRGTGSRAFSFDRKAKRVGNRIGPSSSTGLMPPPRSLKENRSKYLTADVHGAVKDSIAEAHLPTSTLPTHGFVNTSRSEVTPAVTARENTQTTSNPLKSNIQVQNNRPSVSRNPPANNQQVMGEGRQQRLQAPPTTMSCSTSAEIASSCTFSKHQLSQAAHEKYSHNIRAAATNTDVLRSLSQNYTSNQSRLHSSSVPSNQLADGKTCEQKPLKGCLGLTDDNNNSLSEEHASPIKVHIGEYRYTTPFNASSNIHDLRSKSLFGKFSSNSSPQLEDQPEPAMTRRSNLVADIGEQSITNRPSIFGQTLQRNKRKANPTATVKPMRSSYSEVPSAPSTQPAQENVPEEMEQSDEESTSFGRLEMLIKLVKRKKNS